MAPSGTGSQPCRFGETGRGRASLHRACSRGQATAHPIQATGENQDSDNRSGPRKRPIHLSILWSEPPERCRPQPPAVDRTIRTCRRSHGTEGWLPGWPKTERDRPRSGFRQRELRQADRETDPGQVGRCQTEAECDSVEGDPTGLGMKPTNRQIRCASMADKDQCRNADCVAATHITSNLPEGGANAWGIGIRGGGSTAKSYQTRGSGPCLRAPNKVPPPSHGIACFPK